MAEEEKIYVTKARLAQGKAYTEEVETSLGIFKIRPLTYGEKAKAEAMALRGISASQKVDARGKRLGPAQDIHLDLEKTTANDWDVRFYTIACGLSVEKETYTPEEVRSLRMSDSNFKLLLRRIKDISGMTKESREGDFADAESFPGLAGGDGA